ncbi:MAG: YfaP family protein, partial [Poseidonia sp.]
RQRQARLRAQALLDKYSTRSRIGLHRGEMRLLVSMPQVGELPLAEQAAWQERDERRNRNFLELGLLQPNAEAESTPDVDEGVPDDDERLMELEARQVWTDEHEAPMTEHAAVVAEEHVGSGVVVATEEDEEPEVNMDERLEREGGASGDVQISLAWDDYNDLDLHLFCPSGERIYFNNKKSECGGHLDVDMNVRPVSNTPVENVVWAGNAPLGTYKVGVHFYKHHRKRRTKRVCKYRLRVVTHGRSREYLGSIKYGQAMQMVTSFSLADAAHKG